MSHSGHMMPAGSGDGNTRALVISGWLTGIYFLVELGIGIWTGQEAFLYALLQRIGVLHVDSQTSQRASTKLVMSHETGHEGERTGASRGGRPLF